MDKKESYLRMLIREFAQPDVLSRKLRESSPYDVPLDNYPTWATSNYLDQAKKTNSTAPSEDEDLKIIDISGLSTYPRRDEKLPQNKYFVIHHTAIRTSAESVVKILNQERKGVQYIVDRAGKVYQSLPLGSRGAHMKNANIGPRDAGNDTAQGVEVVANDDQDVTYKQAIAVLKLAKHLGFSPSMIFGHGELNTHKMRDEGSRIKSFVHSNFDKPVSEILEDIPDIEDTIKLADAI